MAFFQPLMNQATDDIQRRQMGTRQQGLVNALAGNTGVSGMAHGGLGVAQPQGGPSGGGDFIQAKAIYNTTPEQQAAMSRGQNDLINQQNAASQRDMQFLHAHGGSLPAGWKSELSQTPDRIDPAAYGGKLVGGLDFTGGNAAPTGLGGAMSGFADAAAKMAPGGSLAKPASAFDAAQQVGHDGTTSAGLSRNQYRDMWQASGAKSPADLQKFIDANGGTLQSGNGTVMTPFGEKIDMMKGARTNGNGEAAWGGIDEGGGGGAAPSGRGPAMVGGSPLLQGDASSAIQQALGNMGGSMDNSRLQQLIAALGGQQ